MCQMEKKKDFTAEFAESAERNRDAREKTS
jgi:hypothetical protein